VNTGGPAFPVPDSHHANGQVQFGANGMTLLDWMAGQALANNNIDQHSGNGWPDRVASQAYNIASAMLAEKARREATGKDFLTVQPSREVDNERWARFQDGIRIAFSPTGGWLAEIRDGSMSYGDTIAEAIANLRARWEEKNVSPVVQESSTTDHSPDATKMVQDCGHILRRLANDVLSAEIKDASADEPLGWCAEQVRAHVNTLTERNRELVEAFGRFVDYVSRVNGVAVFQEPLFAEMRAIIAKHKELR
jgi:hypothetical protein